MKTRIMILALVVMTVSCSEKKSPEIGDCNSVLTEEELIDIAKKYMGSHHRPDDCGVDEQSGSDLQTSEDSIVL